MEAVDDNIRREKNYYSMYDMQNIERAKIDPDYLGEAVIANENLIWHSIHKYVGKPEFIADSNGIEKDDILQLGRMGFIKSIYAFDTTRGIKFSSFAVTAIVREVRCFLRDTASIIRLTRTAHSLLIEIRKVENDLGYLPTGDDLAILLDEDVEKIRKVLVVGKPVKYLEESVPTNSVSGRMSLPSVNLTEVLHSDAEVETTVVDKVYIDTIINSIRGKLNDLEFQVLCHRLDDCSQTQTAKELGISQMKVSRIIKRIASLIEKSATMIKYEDEQ